MIQFDTSLGWWSPAVFWYVCISIVLCVIFCLVVFIGGWFDLMFLLKSLDEPAETEETKKNDGESHR